MIIRLRTLCFIGLLIASAAAVMAQPTQRDHFPFLSADPFRLFELRSIALSQDGQRAVAVGAEGAILRSQDGGRSWAVPASPVPTRVQLNGVGLSRDGQRALAVGDGGIIVRSQDGGQRWAVPASLALPHPSLQGVALSTDGQRALAVGDRGTILRSQDGGQSWAAPASSVPTDKQLMSVALSPDGLRALAVGANGTILLSQDGGQNWTVQESSVPTRDHLYSVALSPDGLRALTVGANGTILRSWDRGQSWATPASLPPSLRDGFLYGVALSQDGQRALAVGASGFLRSEDGGQSWAKPAASLPQHHDLRGLAVSPDGQRALAAGRAGTVLRSEDGGRNWEVPAWPVPTREHLNGVALSPDGLRALAVGVNGTILHSQDGGQSWASPAFSAPTDNELTSVALSLDGLRALAVGADGTILRSRDGGQRWAVPESFVPTHDHLFSVALSPDGLRALTVGGNGTILRSRDGGQTWVVPASPVTMREDLRSVALSRDGLRALAVGANGAILLSQDGGQNWTVQESTVPTRAQLNSVALSQDGQRAVAVGSTGSTILFSDDGGQNWAAPTSPPPQSGNLIGLALSHDGQRALAVGENAFVRSEDGGRTWTVSASPVLTRNTFFGAALSQDGQRAIAVGDFGLVLAARLPSAPRLAASRARATGNRAVTYEVEVRPEHAPHIQRLELQFKSGEGAWNNSITAQRDGAGSSWTARLEPGRAGIALGSRIDVQARLDDGGLRPGWLEASHFDWEPFWTRWWRDNKAWATPSLVGISVLLLYVAGFAALLWLAPLRLAGLGGAPALTDLPNDGGWPGFVLRLGARAVDGLALPWFARRRRVRHAFVAGFRSGATPVAQLGRHSRPSVFASDEFLDAWVERHLPQARSALQQLDLVKQRRVYVPLPLRQGDFETGTVTEKPDGKAFRDGFARTRTVVVVVGPGGSGKSTLACALVNWAMADDPDTWPAAHRMLPVFVMGDTVDLLAASAQALRAMLPGLELPEDLLEALLRKKRLLVVLDALSERSEATQRHVETLYAEERHASVNALLITTRRPPEMGAVERTLLFPMPLTGARLVPFISDYLDRRQDGEAVTDWQRVELSGRVLDLVEEARIAAATPLLAQLFVAAALDRARRGEALETLPTAVPDVFLEYLRRIDPDAATADFEERHQPAALALARASLGNNRVPADFRANDLPAEIGDWRRWIANGLIEQRAVAGLQLLRFALDPVAEYLAAIDTVRRCDSDLAAWQRHLDALQAAEGYPTACSGYLEALAVCYRSYRPVLRLPPLSFPWDASEAIAV